MEDLNKYMSNVSTISTIRETVQEFINRKEEYLQLDKLNILSAVEQEDSRKAVNAYKSSIDRFDTLMDFIMDIKNEIFKIKLVKESLDKNTQVGLNQSKVLENLLNILRDILDILNDERAKLDRLVRFYERTSNTYNY